MGTIIIRLEDEELWGSLKHHSQKLYSRYSKLYPRHEVFFWSNNFNNSEANFFEFLKQFNVERVICLDSQIPIAEIVKILNLRPPDVELIIHGYGDFIRQLPRLKPHLLKSSNCYNLKFYFPSTKLCSAFKKIFKTNRGVYLYPLHYTQLTTAPRETFLLPNHFTEVKAGYAGRLEESKNLIETITLLIQADFFDKGSFYLAGALETHIYHFGQKHKDSDYLNLLIKFLKTLDRKVKDKIHFVGDLNESELCAFFKQLDIVINLSTFYGESYGISPRQSIDLGVPILVSDWGGFSDIKKQAGVACLKVNTKKTGVKRFDSQIFKKCLYRLVHLKKAKKEIKGCTQISSPVKVKSFCVKSINVPDEKTWNNLMS